MQPSNSSKVSEKLAELRSRAGLSKAYMARQLGYKQTSGYSYYEDPDQYRKDHLPPEMVQKLLVFMVGLGEPPIAHDEILALAPKLPVLEDRDTGGGAPPATQTPEMSTLTTRPGYLFLTLKQEVTTAQFLSIMKLLHED